MRESIFRLTQLRVQIFYFCAKFISFGFIEEVRSTMAFLEINYQFVQTATFNTIRDIVNHLLYKRINERYLSII